jgi:hypothetical protein
MNSFDRANSWIRNSEASLVNLLSSIAPWLAPIAPAYLSYYHMTNSLAFPSYIAWAVAVVVEVLGLSAISTIITFWAHNRKYRLEVKKAPVAMAVFSFIVYLMVILTINVVLDAAYIQNSGMNPEWVKIGARALLTLLTVPAAIILAVRTQYHEMVLGIEREREERKRERREAVRVLPGNERRKAQFLTDFYSGDLEQRLNGRHLDAEAISEYYQVSLRTAFRWLREIKLKNKQRN